MDNTLPSAPWRVWRTLTEERGWTKEDFRILLHGDMPAKVLAFIRDNKPEDLNAAVVDGDMKLEDLFTAELTAELGYLKGIRGRFLSNMQSHPQITTVQELVAYSKRELFRRPHTSKHTIQYIIDVLATRGITLFEI